MAEPAWIQAKVAAAKAGDVEALGDLIEEYQSTIRGLLAMMGVARDEVEDLAQETFVQAYRSLSRYESDRPLVAWLRGIARNMARRWHQDVRGRISVDDDAILDNLAAEAGNSAEEREEEAQAYRNDWLRRCLEQAPERSLRILRLSYAAGMKSEDIGAEMGMKAAAVRVTLGRIRIQLRKCVENSMRLREA